MVDINLKSTKLKKFSIIYIPTNVLIFVAIYHNILASVTTDFLQVLIQITFREFQTK